ncbi:MAG: transketolase [Methyloceanibacter sp.]|uniref:transketolase n=1 Tax=Methyloceanibacter sp. TaxID=1965321 RepID=UPI003D6CD306
MTQTRDELDQLAINTIRTLSIDAIQKANSGHPGTAMDAAPTAYILWQQFLRYDPTAPHWINRDRFVLSAGHASMLLYSLIHLAGIQAAESSYQKPGGDAVTLQDIETFREEGSRCPGHPEYGWTSGVESTTGPLGQGVATSVGMAMAGKWLAATYNKPDFDIFDFNVYALCGEGCLMEGVGSEAASLAGHLKLSNLCWIFDNNNVTIDGHTNITFTEDVAKRFDAYGWKIVHVADANDLGQLAAAYNAFLATDDQPTIIIVHSHIGYGSPGKHDTPAAHGEPLGPDEVRRTKEFLGFDPDKFFVVPDGVRGHFTDGMGKRGADAHASWEALFADYAKKFPYLAAEVELIRTRGLPKGWDSDVPTFAPDAKGIATREASGKVLNAIAAKVPWVMGGAADVAGSTKVILGYDDAGEFQPYGELGDYSGHNLRYGIREHAMCAIVNGMVLTGLRAYASAYLIFTDYARGAIRLSSLMDLPVLHIWTHDSISLGQDGPTHQPIEQLVSLRAIPGMMVVRPADANETAEAYRLVMPLTNRPAALILSRQALPIFDRSTLAPASGLAKGAYVLAEAAGGKPDVILIGTGSEVSLCLAARDLLAKDKINARVVSMPCRELFEAQDEAYRESVLPAGIAARVTVEEASPIGWDRYAGPKGVVLGMNTFGLSAPIEVVNKHFGFTPERVAAAARMTLGL